MTFCVRSLLSALRHLTAKLHGTLQVLGEFSPPLGAQPCSTQSFRMSKVHQESFRNVIVTPFTRLRKNPKSIFLQDRSALDFQRHKFDSLTAARLDDSTFPPQSAEH